jgi:IS30 family transposase
MSYKHLTQEQRYHIQAYKSIGYTNTKIAKEIGVHPATVGRELKRNKGEISGIYFAYEAHEKYKKREQEQSKKANLKLTDKNIALIKKYLKQDYSPEQISATIKQKYNINISLVTIYSFIYEEKLNGGKLYTHLRQKGKRRAKYGKARKNRIPDRVSIEKRPQIVDDKSRVGDFEADTIIGKGKKGAIVTIVDRKSMFVKISLPVSKRANIVANEMVRLLGRLKNKVHTITTDNGLEFAHHKTVSQKLKCDYYFCHPYSSWERGLNENINGLIRQYIPKGSSFENLTAKDIQKIENRLNYRPRKTLGWKTPYEVFYEKLKAS